MIFNRLKQLIHNQTLATTLITLATTASFVIFNQNFKLALFLSLIYLFLFYLLTKNIFISVYSILFISGLFYFPIKRYEVELLPGRLFYYLDEFKHGLLGVYGLTTSDVYSLIIVLMMLFKIFQPKRKLKITISLVLKQPVVGFSVLLWLVYFFFSLISSFYISSYPTFSFTIALQSTKFLITFFATIYLFVHYPKSIHWFYTLITSMLISESIFTFISLLHFDISGIALSTYLSPDERTLLPRVIGIIGHPNQDALITFTLLLLSIPILKQSKSLLTKLAFSLAIFNLLLFQSRTIWLAMIFCIFLAIIHYRHRFRSKININKKQFYYFLAVIILNISVILPRVRLSSLFFTESGGGALRYLMLEEGFYTLLQSPLNGFGVQNTVISVFNYFPEGYVRLFPVPVHFSPLELALESGLIAAICFLLPFYLYLRQSFKVLKNKRESYPEIFALVCTLTTILIYFSMQPLDNLKRDFMLYGILFGWGSFYQFKAKI